MRRFVRSLALVITFVGLAVFVVLGAREVVLALDTSLRWPEPHWWRWLLDPAHSGRATLAGIVCVALAVVALSLAALAGRRPARRPAQIHLAADGSATQASASAITPDTASAITPDTAPAITSVRTAALERLVSVSLDRKIAEVCSPAVSLRRLADGFAVVVVANVTAIDLVGLQHRLATCAAGELERATGIGLARLDLDVRRFISASPA